MRERSMLNNRRISLASGVLPEFSPLVVAQSAVDAGYSDAGLMVRPEVWDLAWESELLDIKAQHGLGFLDVEVLWIPKGGVLGSAHQFLVDVGGRLGAEHILVVSDECDPDLLAPALDNISQWCAGYSMRPMLEFLRITAVTSLRQTKELLAASQAHNFGILLDSLHLMRSSELDELPVLDAEMHPYIQLCDGVRTTSQTAKALLSDAVDGRSAPGEGELPLEHLLRALPKATPLSLEVRSKRYREQYIEPLARAKAVLEQTQIYLRKQLNE